MPSPKILVIASLADDTVFYERSGARETRKGGPAFWIAKELNRLEIQFIPNYGSKVAQVEVNVLKTGRETGRVISVPHIELPEIPPQADAVIVSTILNEFLLEGVAQLQGLIALDVQGYTRQARMSGINLNLRPEILERITILKATEDELQWIDPELVEDQKKHRILIVTMGSKGITTFAYGESHFSVPTQIVLGIRDTIGAGDTLLAAFVANFLKTKSVLQAQAFALKEVSDFLREK